MENTTYKNSLLGTFKLDYKGGHPSIAKEKTCSLKVYSDSVTITCGYNTATISMGNILSCQIESQDQIESRITATRLLALGVFALAFKKKKKTTNKYLTIDFHDDKGLGGVILFEGKDSLRAHSTIYNAIVNYKQNVIQSSHNIDSKNQSPISDPYEEIKKAKELLDMGILTQEEFELKKKQLLDL